MRGATVGHIRELIVVMVIALGAWQPAAPLQARPHTLIRQLDAPANGLPAGRLPDVLGFRPGISLREAYRLLQAYKPKGTLEVGEVQLSELGGKKFPATLLYKSTPVRAGQEAAEIIQLEMTLPPERPVVWGILRRRSFEAGEEAGRSNLLAELRQKYGRENHGITVPIVSLYWAFDEHGQRVETGSGTLNNCAVPGTWDMTLKSGNAPGAKSSTFPGSSLLLGRPTQNQGSCKPLVYVKAFLQPSGRRGLELIESTTVAVINGALAARAQAATSAYLTNAVEAQKKQEPKKTQQRPKAFRL